MTLKKTVSFILFLFIFSTVSYSNSQEVEPSHSSKIKLSKVITKKKTVDKKIVYLMILGLIIPISVGYYVIKKK